MLVEEEGLENQWLQNSRGRGTRLLRLNVSGSSRGVPLLQVRREHWAVDVFRVNTTQLRRQTNLSRSVCCDRCSCGVAFVRDGNIRRGDWVLVVNFESWRPVASTRLGSYLWDMYGWRRFGHGSPRNPPHRNQRKEREQEEKEGKDKKRRRVQAGVL